MTTLDLSKRLIPFPDPQTPEEYDIMKLRRILHECEHDRESEFTKQMDKVDALVNVLPADRDSADILKAARVHFPNAQMAGEQ